MKTDALIESLSEEVRPVPRNGRVLRLGLGILAGSIVTLILIALALGIRPDLETAMRGHTSWMKWAYTGSLGIGALAMTARLARPEAFRLGRFWPLLIPSALLAIVGTIEMARVPTGAWMAMWLGQSGKICRWLLLILSARIFIGLLWSFRHLAPTRLRAAGAAAGLAAGAWAVTFYCLHCPEVSAIIVLTWYTLSMVLAAGAGALIGPSVLR